MWQVRLRAMQPAMRSLMPWQRVKSTTTTVPVHLQDKHYGGAEKLGHGIGYRYAHDYPEHYVKQQYLPDELVGQTFYHPTDIGYEKVIGDRL